MIKAIRDLGFFELKEVSGKDIFDIKEFEEVRKTDPQLIAKLIAEKIEPPVKVYALKIKNSKLTYEIDESIYKDINTPRDDEERSYRNYLFKKPRSTRGEEKGTYLSLSFKLVDTSDGKLFGYLRKLRSVLKSNNVPKEIKELFKLVDKGKDAFKKGINKEFEKIKKLVDIKKNFVMVTIKPDGKNLIEHKVLTDDFIKRFVDEYRYPEDKVPESYNPEVQKGQCSVCLRENLDLLGYIRPYNFFTVDKIGFYPSFKNYESWKYFPVCESCGILIQAGKNFIDRYFDTKNLKTNIAGYNAKVIFKTKEIVDKYKRFADIGSFQKIAGLEKHFIKSLPQLKNVESYNFLFYEEVKNQFEILSLIPDVLPSRIKKIVDSIEKVKDSFYVSNWFDLDKIQKNEGDWRIDADFYFLEEGIGERTDLPKIEYSPTKVKVLDLIQSVFVGNPVAYREVVYEITSKIQLCFKQALRSAKDNRPIIDKFAAYVFSGAATTEFLKEVGVMEIENTKTGTGGEYPEKLKEIFEKHNVFFDMPQKRACFLIGVLYGKLEALQASPLIGKKGTSLGWLRSLDLRWDYLIKDMFPRVHMKFKEYDNATPILGKEVKEVFTFTSSEIEGCGGSGLEREEIPFYFTLGWTSYKSFLPPKSKQEDVDENNKEEQK